MIATSSEGKLSKVDLRYGNEPVWEIENSTFEPPSTQQSLAISNNDSYAVVNGRGGKVIVFNLD